MGLLPSAPDVEVFAPTTLFVGRDAAIQIVVTAKQDTKIDFIDARLVGRQGWTTGAGKSRRSVRVTFPELVARVGEAGVLPAGVTRLATHFTLPPGTPPTHAIDPAFATLELRVHVSIPWWPDGRYRFTLPVRVPPPPMVIRTPVALRSTAPDAPADKPRLEVSLASSRLIVGETVVGSCAMFHLDDRKAREVELAFVPTVALHGRWRAVVRRGRPFAATVTVPAGGAGTSVPFAIRIPETVIPTFGTVTHALGWTLVATSGSFFGTKLELALPLELVDASAGATAARLTVAPQLGDARTTAIFERFAHDRGWQPTADDDGALAIEHELAHGEIAIAYSYRGKDGTFLIGRVASPSLGLGLSAEPASAVRHVFFRDLEIGHAAWDRGNNVAARSAAQATPVLQVLVPSVLDAASALGSLVRWTDDAIVFERAVVSVDDADLAATSAALEALAGALAGARAAIAPPPELVVEVAAWHALAERLHGQLTIGDLSLDGTLDGAPVSVGVEWADDQRPIRIWASVGDAARATPFTLALARPAADSLADPAAEPLVELLTRWPDDFVDLRIADGVATAAWAFSDNVADAGRVRALVEGLRALVAALDPKIGPYR